MVKIALSTISRALCLPLILSLALCAAAQNYSSTDTVTEYPNKGTFYHDKFEGRKTANGEIFDQNKFTAAHWKIKLGTYVMVTNRNTGLQVIVRVNDRCPKHGVFDLSHRAASAIGIRGMQPVTVRLLGDGWHERWLAQETMFDSVSSRLTGKQPTQKTQKVADTKTKPADTEAKPETPTNHKTAPQNVTSHSKQNRYNIVLGNAENHSVAYSMRSTATKYVSRPSKTTPCY